MTRAEVVEVVTQQGFKAAGQPESNDDNDSLYEPYLRGDEQLWLGNAFVEVEWQMTAMDYRHENKASLLRFISTGG